LPPAISSLRPDAQYLVQLLAGVNQDVDKMDSWLFKKNELMAIYDSSKCKGRDIEKARQYWQKSVKSMLRRLGMMKLRSMTKVMDSGAQQPNKKVSSVGPILTTIS
jgi:hypothetical protein